MADDIKVLKDRISKAVKSIEEQLKDLEVMQDLSASGEIDISWMNEIEERVAKAETVIERLLKKFNI